MGNEEFIKLDLSFTTADVSEVKITFDKALILCLKDWEGRKIKVEFPYIVAFRFESMGVLKHRDDEIYLIKNSKWLLEQKSILKQNSPLDKEPSLKHIRFCFNATDEILDVIFDEEEGYEVNIIK